MFVFLLTLFPIFSNAQSIYLFKNEKGQQIVGVPKLKYRALRENLLLCDSAIEAHNDMMYQYDSILTIFRKKIELKDQRIEQQELTITQLNENFKANNTELNQQLVATRKKHYVKGIVHGSLGTLAVLSIISLLINIKK